MIMENYVNKEYYLPLLKRFCEIALPLYECGYPQGPFIPYTMPNYGKAKLKVMFVGQDTKGWTRYNVLDKAFKSERLSDYLEENISNVRVEKALMAWGNNIRAFWPFADKLYLLIRTGEYVSDLKCLDDEQIEILKEVGYGNLHSIEIPDTLRRRFDYYEDDLKVWDLITNIELYNCIREAARPFETIKSMIEAYNPDYMFVLAWKGSDEEFFENTDYLWQEGFKGKIEEKKYQAVYLSKTYKTKVIWSLHPSSFRPLKFTNNDIKDLCYYLAGTCHQLESSK